MAKSKKEYIGQDWAIEEKKLWSLVKRLRTRNLSSCDAMQELCEAIGEYLEFIENDMMFNDDNPEDDSDTLDGLVKAFTNVRYVV